MEPKLACRICSGELRLHIPGSAGALTAEALSPSNHELGRHRDLLTCRECGSVQQPALSGGAALHELYRAMADDAYLAEGAGRRATAARVLGLIA